MSCPAHELAASRDFLSEEDIDFIVDLIGLFPGNAVVADVGGSCIGGASGGGSGTTACAAFAGGATRVITQNSDEEALHWTGVAMENIGRAKDWEGNLHYAGEAKEFDVILLDNGDLEEWMPRLKEGGVIWIHDEITPEAFPEEVGLIEIGSRGKGWAGRKQHAQADTTSPSPSSPTVEKTEKALSSSSPEAPKKRGPGRPRKASGAANPSAPASPPASSGAAEGSTSQASGGSISSATTPPSDQPQESDGDK